MNDVIKLVVFDLNETLIEENTWYELNMTMGLTDEEDRNFMKWYEEGVISYEEGQRLIGKIYLARGKATKENILAAMKYTYKPGAVDLIKYLKDKNYRIVLLSGSIDVLVSKVAGELGIHDWAAHNKIEFDDENKFKRIVCRGDDIDFKEEMLLKYVNEMGILPTQAVCVGDAYNDKKLFSLSKHGVAIKNSNAEVGAWKVIDGLEELKKLI